MLNTLEFINSKDIAKHLDDINYSFNTIETAWLIWQSRKHTLREKIQAWQVLISTMSDCSVKRRDVKVESLHDCIRKYIDYQERLICEFQTYDNEWVYKYGVEDEDGHFFHMDGVYSIYEKCLTEIKERIECGWHQKIKEFRITKIKLDESDRHVTAYCRNDLSLMCFFTAISDEGNKLEVLFDELCLYFPTPFKKGDILIDLRSSRSGLYSGPFVLLQMRPDKSDKRFERYLQSGDSTDMSVIGYFQDEIGEFYGETITDSCIDCGYFRGEFTGKKRALKALSNFMKGNICESLFAYAHRQIITEEILKASEAYYLKEDLELAGLR